MTTNTENTGESIFLVTISKNNELYAIKKGFNRDVVFQGPFSALKEIGTFIRIAWYIVYAIAFIIVGLSLGQILEALNINYPAFTKYILSYAVTNFAFSFFIYYIKKISVQFSNIPSAVQTADDPDDAMVKSGDALRAQNGRNGINNAFSD